MANKPSIPKGTRDFGPTEMAKRNYIFETIRSVYALYGYQQIETPAMETLQTLMGKYGEEGDRLLFKILNSGDYFKSITDQELTERNTLKLQTKLCEKGLRYDLTVPFARYVVMHRDELQLPFKRYQIQPVWRADRPQKGRYREFYQCDADVIGSESLLNEVELMQIIDIVFTRFGIRVVIKINNRKILTGIAETIGEADKIITITTAIDKLEKIGKEKVNEELAQNGLSNEAINRLQPIIELQGSNNQKLDTIASVLAESETGKKGVDEIQFILHTLENTGLKNEIQLDLTLARGLNTGIFGMPGISGVGISFGADRIYDVLNTLNLYPNDSVSGTQILFTNFGTDETRYIMPIIATLRQAGIRTELYPDALKMKKQMTYANAKHIPFVAIAGADEIKNGEITLKNMLTGEQTTLSPTLLLATLQEHHNYT